MYVEAVYPNKERKTSQQKLVAKSFGLLVKDGRRTVVGLRQLRVRSTTAWKPGTSIAATYHKSKPSAVIRNDLPTLLVATSLPTAAPPVIEGGEGEGEESEESESDIEDYEDVEGVESDIPVLNDGTIFIPTQMVTMWQC